MKSDRLHSNEITLKKLTLAGGQFCKTHSLKLHGVSKHVLGDFFKKWAILGLFLLFSSFRTNITILTAKKREKMSIQ